MRNVLSNSMKVLAATAGIAAVMALATPAQAANGHDSVVWQFQHFVDCKILLLTNPKRHAELCLPGHINFDFLPASNGFQQPEECPWEEYAKKPD